MIKAVVGVGGGSARDREYPFSHPLFRLLGCQVLNGDPSSLMHTIYLPLRGSQVFQLSKLPV